MINPWQRFRELYPNYKTKYEVIIEWIDQTETPFKARDVNVVGRSSGHLYRILSNLVRKGFLKHNGVTYEKTENWLLAKAIKVNYK